MCCDQVRLLDDCGWGSWILFKWHKGSVPKWNSTLSSKPMIEHNVTKARKSFFAYGSIGVYQGAISPLSCHSPIKTCHANPPLWMWKLVPLWQFNEGSELFSWWALQKSVEVAKMVFQHCLNDCYGLSISGSTLFDQETLFPTLDHRLIWHSQFKNSSSPFKWHWVCLICECLQLEEHLKTNFWTHSLLISSCNPESGEEDGIYETN